MAIPAGDILYKVNADTGQLERTMKKTEAGFKKSFTNMGQTAKRVGIGMTAAGAGLAAGLGGAVKSAVEFQGALAEVNTLGVKNIQGLGDAIKDVSVRFGQDLTTSVQATYQAISAGVSELEAPLILEKAAIAATAGVTDLKTAIELGTGITNAFGLEMADMDEIFDAAFIGVKDGVTTFEELAASVGKVAPSFAAAGLSVDEMIGSIAALTKGNVATAEAVTAMKQVMTGIIKPTDEMNKAFQDLGGPLQAIQELGVQGFLEELKERTGGNIETLGKMFGSVEALNAVLALTGEQASSFSAIMEDMAEKTGATKKAFDIITDGDPAFIWKQIKAAIEVLRVEIGDALLPALGELAEGVFNVVKKVTDWMKANPELTEQIIKWSAAAAALMLTLGPLLIIMPGIIAVAGAMISPLGLVAAAVGVLAFAFADDLLPIIKGMPAYFKENKEEIDRFLQAAKTSWKTTLDAITTILDITADAWWTILVDMAAMFGIKLGEIDTDLKEGEQDTKTTLDRWTTNLETFDTFVKGKLKSVKDAYKTWGRDIVEILSFVVGISYTSARVIGNTLQFLLKGIEVVINAVAVMFNAFRGKISTDPAVDFGVFSQGFGAFSDALDAAMFSFAQGKAAFALEGTEGFAAGGTTKHNMVKVGERGPEAAFLPQGTRVIPHGEAMRALQGFAAGGVIGEQNSQGSIISGVNKLLTGTMEGWFQNIFARQPGGMAKISELTPKGAIEKFGEEGMIEMFKQKGFRQFLRDFQTTTGVSPGLIDNMRDFTNNLFRNTRGPNLPAFMNFHRFGNWMRAMFPFIKGQVSANPFDLFPREKFLAAGGLAGGMSIVGERGPEVAAFPSGTRIMSNADMRAAMGGRGQRITNVTVEIGTVNANDQDQVDALMEQFGAAIVDAENAEGLLNG